MMIKTRVWLAIIASLTTVVMAQEVSVAKKEAKEKPSYAVSFVVVGARSDAYWVGDGADMKVFAHDPGALPPKDVYLAVPQEKGDGASSKKKRTRLMLSLNVPTERVTLRGNECRLSSRHASGEDFAYKNFTSALLPKKIDPYTVFLARQPKHRTWKSPKHVVFSDSKVKFPLGSARIVNMSDRPIVIQRGKKVLGRVAPGKGAIIKKALKLKNSETVTVMYLDKGKKRLAFRRALNFPKDQRVNIACTYVPKRSKPLLAHLFATAEPPQPPVAQKKKSTVAQSNGVSGLR